MKHLHLRGFLIIPLIVFLSATATELSQNLNKIIPSPSSSSSVDPANARITTRKI